MGHHGQVIINIRKAHSQGRRRDNQQPALEEEDGSTID